MPEQRGILQRGPQLPDGWAARVPVLADIEALVELLSRHQQAAVGSGSVDADAVATEAAGIGSWTRRQLVVLDDHDQLQAWARVHDRAAGRTVIAVDVDPSCHEDELARSLFAWAEGAAVEIAGQRHLTSTLLDSGAYAGDQRQREWLAGAGYQQVRTWLQMSRPVLPEEAEPGALPPLREGVRVRSVAEHENGLPLAADLQTVHQLLEESFVDHFNSYRESFPEFVQRLREDPGHRWDHWWIATVDIDGVDVPAGALVSTVLPADVLGTPGSYVDYIGVHRRARGRGVAKALLYTVIADAARRGRNRVGLEVDADSPTNADALYTSMGWQSLYRTESWHRTVSTVAASDGNAGDTGG
ncbi:MAG: GNAT family N-acetyltransferase [Propionibacteriaceae bacterium]